MLRSLPCGVSELGEAVRSGDVTLIDREMLQAVHDLVGALTCLCYQLVCVRIFICPFQQATTEELSTIKTHLKSPHPQPLDTPEM